MEKIIETLNGLQAKMPFQTIIVVLLVTTILSSIIFLTYKYTYSGVIYSSRFNVSLVMITLITAIVMVVIGSNISVSLGMVGALSIVRFRTAVKDPRDTAFIFWGIVIGLACGTQNYHIAVFGSMLICIVLFIFRYVVKKDSKYVLIVKGNRIDVKVLESHILTMLKGYDCKGLYVTGDYVEAIYDVRFNKEIDNTIIENIKTLPGVEAVNIVQSNTETMG